MAESLYQAPGAPAAYAVADGARAAGEWLSTEQPGSLADSKQGLAVAARTGGQPCNLHGAWRRRASVPPTQADTLIHRSTPEPGAPAEV